MSDIEEHIKNLLDNYSDNKKLIDESKKNIKTKLTILILSFISIGLLSPLLFMYELPIFLFASLITFVTPQLITLKMQGSYFKNIKNIINYRKNMDNHLIEFKKAKDIEVSKEDKVSKQLEEQRDKHNLRQKELEMAFSDENYYPYIERIKRRTLKR